jgi:glycosyltransferase involved in cell wall biosynthesis
MQVLWLSHVVPYPPKAGVLLRAYHLLKGVAARHDVHLVAFIQRPLLATFYSDPDAGLAECRAELSRFCRSITLLPIEKAERPLGKIRTAAESLLRGGGYTASWLDGPSAAATIERIARERRYDVAHFDSISLASYRQRLAAVPATLGHHNAEAHMMVRRAALEPNYWRRLYFRQEGLRLGRYEGRVADWFRLHVTCSELDSDRLRATMPTAQFLAVPNGVDPDYFAPAGLEQRPDSVIFVGTMSWYPNVDAVAFFLREVWPLLRAKVPTVTFDIVGADAPVELRELAARSPGVTLHGFVPEIRPVIERAALYVCPIRDGGGTKLKILDALAMSKCVLAHPVACEGISVSAGVDVVFAESAEEFASQASALLASPERRRAIGAAARQLATSKYNFAALAEHLASALVAVARNESVAGA